MFIMYNMFRIVICCTYINVDYKQSLLIQKIPNYIYIALLLLVKFYLRSLYILHTLSFECYFVAPNYQRLYNKDAKPCIFNNTSRFLHQRTYVRCIFNNLLIVPGKFRFHKCSSICFGLNFPNSQNTIDWVWKTHKPGEIL